MYNYWYCDHTQVPRKVEDRFRRDNPCVYRDKTRSGTTAITYSFAGTFWSEYYTLWCPFWLGIKENAPKFTSLQDYAYQGDSFESIRKTIDGWNQVRGLTMHHETNHWPDVSDPNCLGNEEYKPHYIASHALYGPKNDNSKGYEFNLRNAHS